MRLHRPRPLFLVAAANRPLQLPFDKIDTKVPYGAWLRLDYALVSYPVTVVAGVQTSPNLTFDLISSNGIQHNEIPIDFADVTTPVKGTRIRASQGLRILLAPAEIITMRVRDMAAGPVPATISITYLCQLGWGLR